MFSFKTKTSGFTLIELLIAITIFAMMITMVLSIYFSTTNSTRKLNMQRELAESAREIIERVTEDITEKWMTWNTIGFDINYDLWKSYDYSGTGSEYLNLNHGRYVYWVKKSTGMDTCTGIRKTDSSIHCGLYFVNYSDNWANWYNLVDSFNPDESKKRIKVTDLKFNVSGDGINVNRKVVMNFTLELMPRNGLSKNYIDSTKLHIQTTISERAWKK